MLDWESVATEVDSIREIGKNYQSDAHRKGVRIRKIVDPSRRIAKEVLAELEGRLVHGASGIGRREELRSETRKGIATARSGSMRFFTAAG